MGIGRSPGAFAADDFRRDDLLDLHQTIYNTLALSGAPRVQPFAGDCPNFRGLPEKRDCPPSS